MTFAFRCTGLGIPESVRTRLADDDVAARLVAEDPTLWGPEAEREASVRLGWLDLPATSRSLVGRLAELRAELQSEGLDRVVLCGMGGSSLAPEVICRTAGVPLVVLDTTDPHQVAAALTDLDRTVVVVSSKSGGTVETDSHRRAFIQAFGAAGLDEQQIGARFVVVTDPGSPLAETASVLGAREVFLADPNVGGRYSALSAFGRSRRRWPGRTSARCSRRPPSWPSSWPSRTTPRSNWAWRWVRASAPAATRSPSPTATRRSPASATGPNS